MKIFLSFRPYLHEMLDILKKEFEVIVFTSGQKDYAHKVLDMIETGTTYFDYRLVKDDCLYCRKLDMYIKDLSMLSVGRDLKDIIIVDNCSVNYMLQMTNGVPIKDYNGDKKDTILYNLTRYLM